MTSLLDPCTDQPSSSLREFGCLGESAAGALNDQVGSIVSTSHTFAGVSSTDKLGEVSWKTTEDKTLKKYVASHDSLLFSEYAC